MPLRFFCREARESAALDVASTAVFANRIAVSWIRTMFARSAIAVAWSPTDLTVVYLHPTKHHLKSGNICRVPLPTGIIDIVTGQVLDRRALGEVVRQVPIFLQPVPARCDLFLVVPSSVALMQTWVEEGNSKSYSRQDLMAKASLSLTDKRDGIIAEIYQREINSRGCTKAMLLLAREDLVRAYVSALGSHQHILARTTTAEIARYNLWCALYPHTVFEPLLFISGSDEHLEITMWQDGVACLSERLMYSAEMHRAASSGGLFARGNPAPSPNRGGVSTHSRLVEVFRPFYQRLHHMSAPSFVIITGSLELSQSIEEALLVLGTDESSIHRLSSGYSYHGSEGVALKIMESHPFRGLFEHCEAFGAVSAYWGALGAFGRSTLRWPPVRIKSG